MRPWVVVAALAAATALAADPIRIPDRSTGVINGKVAVMLWPASGFHRDARVDALLPAEGCVAHLIPAERPATELTYPCGKWFQPPEGSYRLWLEAGDLITPIQGGMNYVAEPFKGMGMGEIMGVERGGRVALDPAVPLPSRADFRLVSLDSCCDATHASRAFERRATANNLRAGVLMPAGRVSPGIFDTETNDAIALARPVLVQLGKTITVAPKPPAPGRADVLLILDRVRLRVDPKLDNVTGTLDGKAPDMLTNTSDRVYAAWYGVPAQAARLAVDAKGFLFPPRMLSLKSGKVTTVRGRLAPLPKLGVSLLAPQHAFPDDVRLTIVAASGERVRTAKAIAGELVKFEAMPAEPLQVVLYAGAWRFVRTADLSSGRDATVVFDLHPIVVSGHVYSGRDAAPDALVALEADDGQWVETTTASDGFYTLTLWHPRDAYQAEITIHDRAGPPFEEGFLSIKESTTLDFHVPNTRYTVHVVDALTGTPVAGASVSAQNIWMHPSGSPQRVLQIATSDHRGIATLPPVRPGELHLRARARGYRDSGIVDTTVADAEGTGDFDLRLQSAGTTAHVNVQLADSRPAAAAELWAVSSTSGELPSWQGTTDASGAVEVPLSARGALLLVRSRDAASAVRPFRPDETNGATIVLGPPAPPLEVQIGPRVRVSAWIDGIRVSGPALTFLTWSFESADAGGAWRADNLPQTSLRIMATRAAAPAEIARGAYDATATILPYPWQPHPAVRPVD